MQDCLAAAGYNSIFMAQREHYATLISNILCTSKLLFLLSEIKKSNKVEITTYKDYETHVHVIESIEPMTIA